MNYNYCDYHDNIFIGNSLNGNCFKASNGNLIIDVYHGLYFKPNYGPNVELVDALALSRLFSNSFTSRIINFINEETNDPINRMVQKKIRELVEIEMRR